MSSRGTPPGRSSIGSSKHPTIVDSTPTVTAPPSTIRSMRPSRSPCTCAAVVGETWPEQIRRRRHHRSAEGAQDLARDRVGGNADRDGVEPGGGEIGHRAVFCFRQHQRQRSRPERLGQRQRGRIEPGDPARGIEIADMGDQRVESRPALGLVKPGNRRRIGSVGTEAIDGLGRERDQPALQQGSAPRRHGGRGRPAKSGS